MPDVRSQARHPPRRAEVAETSSNAGRTSSQSVSSYQSLDDEPRNLEVEESGSIARTVKKNRRCPFCQSAFSKHEHLARHLRSHTKEKPFQCSDCDKRFGRNDTLLRHMRSHPASRRNKPVRQNANSATGGILSPITRESGQFRSHEMSDMVQNASSIIVESQAQNAGNALLDREGDDSDITYPGINTGRQGLLHMDASNSSASLVSGLQTRSYEFSSPNNDLTQSPWGAMTIDAQPSLGIEDDFMNVSSASLDVSDMNSLSSTWFAGDDFDLDALNSAIQESIAHYAYPMQSYPTDHRTQLPSIEHVETEGVLPTHPSLSTLYSSSISKKWFSNIEVDSEAPETRQGSQGPGSAQVDVDEAYRVNLTNKLQVRAHNESLPSTEFLNLCIRMYFTRFNPIFPLLHGPTFRPSAKNSLLLLSICSVGSLFIGSADAIAQGTRIFERLNKAILASWELHLARGSEALSMIQAAIIGQTFGLLSGNPWHLTLVDAFHGTVVAWARRSKMFSNKQAKIPSCDLRGQELSQEWQRWARREETVRVLLGLHIHDSELACIFHHEPILRHSGKAIPLACSSKLFMASIADQWMAISQKEKCQTGTEEPRPGEILGSQQSLSTCIVAEPGSFTAYAFLAGIAARICERRNLGELDKPSKVEFVDELIHWYQNFRESTERADPLCLMSLWHSTFMTLLVDLDMLERAVGRDTPEVLQSSKNDLSSWISTLDAKRCIIHGLLAHQQAKEMQIGIEPAIHVPRTLFFAGIALFCYTARQMNPRDKRENWQRELLSLPEIKLLDTSNVMYIFEQQRNRSDNLSAIEAGALCNITDLLQRIGHWEIARKYASTLESLLNVEKGYTEMRIE